MLNSGFKASFIIFIIVTHFIFASEPKFYVKKNTWPKTLWTSLNLLEKLEKSGELNLGMPDFGGSNFSIMAWVKTSAEKGTIFTKVANNAERPEAQGKALYLEEGILQYQIESVGVLNSEYKINDGLWHHVVVTGRNPHQFYIDGIKIKATQFDNRTMVKPDSKELNLRIGMGTWGYPFKGFVTFNGVIDEVKIYNRKLPQNEIVSTFKGELHIKKGLAGWWQFESFYEEDGEDLVADLSSFKNNGEPSGCEITAGKIGNGFLFSGHSGVRISKSAGLTSRNIIWDLLAEDFSSEKEVTKMLTERQDGIWNQSFGDNGIKKIANCYSDKTRDFGNLKDIAVQLANSAASFEYITELRDVYHLSISAKELYSSLSSKINSTELAVNHLIRKFGNEDLYGNKYLEMIEDFKKQAEEIIKRPSDSKYAIELENKFKKFQYNALVANNPLLNFDEILFTKRFTYQSSHYYTDFIDGTENPGGNLSILSLKDGTVKDILPDMSKGIFGRYDLSFDADKIVFDWKEKNGKGFRIFETELDGRNLTQLTDDPDDEGERIAKYDNSHLGGTSRIYQHHTDDMHPCYLPDGGIVFSSTRCEFSILCDGPTKLTTAVLYRMDGDGKNITKLTNSAVSEFSPAIMNDGRILYNRWEYVDKGQIAVKCLWAMHPDGSSTQEIYGNDIPYPPVFIHGRPIPGTNNQFVCLGTPHFPQSGVGTVIRIDINKPIRTQEPMTYITPDVDIRTEGGFHHKIDDKWVRTDDGPLYMDPYPLSDKFFLVSHNPDKKWNDVKAYGLYLIDEYGNHVKIYQDPEYSSWQPMPLVSRIKPPVIPSVRHFIENEPEEAVVIMTDVYEGLEGIEKGSVKYLRVLEQVPRPWSSRRMWEYDGGAPAIGRSVLGLKVLHGVVPVHEDGSAHFIVPANKNIYFEALDKNYMELQRQRTYINYKPGERRTCIGCHELRQFSPSNKEVKALSLEPVRPHAQPGETAPRAIHFMADVQPVLDRHCIGCHNHEDEAGDLVLTGELTEMFNVSYENIMEKNLVRTVSENDDFEDTEPLAPKSLGSHASIFITTIVEGHHGIKLPMEEFVKLTTWVDANAQYYGTYYGRQNIEYADHPDFRPLHTFEQTIGSKPPFKEQNDK